MEHKYKQMILTGLLALSLVFAFLPQRSGIQAMELLLTLPPVEPMPPLILKVKYQCFDTWIFRSVVRLNTPGFSFYSEWKHKRFEDPMSSISSSAAAVHTGDVYHQCTP